jgi:PAS domain-containing protein
VGIQSEIVPWLALALSVLAVVFAVKAILDWRDWRLTPLAIGLALMCSGPLLEIASREGRIGDDRYHLVTGYRGMLIALFSIAAVAALRRLMERERGLRLAAERSDQLARVNVELETELDQRRKAERALADAEARLRAILDNTPANIFIKDLEGRYLYRNDPRVLHEESAFVPDFVG